MTKRDEIQDETKPATESALTVKWGAILVLAAVLVSSGMAWAVSSIMNHENRITVVEQQQKSAVQSFECYRQDIKEINVKLTTLSEKLLEHATQAKKFREGAK